jgi:NADP-dependent 3-hydroxy acid dehydrogenase YdfG
MNYSIIRSAESQLGQAFAWIFAAHKKHLILLGKDEGLLKSIAFQVGNQFKVQIHYFACDESDTSAVTHICNYINDHYDVDCLVNHSGIIEGACFADSNIFELSRKLTLSMVAGPLFIHQLLPNLLKQANGYILMPVASGTDVLTKALNGFCSEFTGVFNREMLSSGHELRCRLVRLPAFELSSGNDELDKMTLCDNIERILNDVWYDEPSVLVI